MLDASLDGYFNNRAVEMRLKPWVSFWASVHFIIARSDPLEARVVCSGVSSLYTFVCCLFYPNHKETAKKKKQILTNAVCNAPVTMFSNCLEVVCQICCKQRELVFILFLFCPCESFDLLFLPGLTIKACRATEAL